MSQGKIFLKVQILLQTLDSGVTVQHKNKLVEICVIVNHTTSSELKSSDRHNAKPQHRPDLIG